MRKLPHRPAQAEAKAEAKAPAPRPQALRGRRAPGEDARAALRCRVDEPAQRKAAPLDTGHGALIAMSTERSPQGPAPIAALQRRTGRAVVDPGYGDVVQAARMVSVGRVASGTDALARTDGPLEAEVAVDPGYGSLIAMANRARPRSSQPPVLQAMWPFGSSASAGTAAPMTSATTSAPTEAGAESTPWNYNRIHGFQEDLDKHVVESPLAEGVKSAFTKRVDVLKDPPRPPLKEAYRWARYAMTTPQQTLHEHVKDAAVQQAMSMEVDPKSIYQTGYTMATTRPEDFEQLSGTVGSVASSHTKMAGASMATGVAMSRGLARLLPGGTKVLAVVPTILGGMAALKNVQDGHDRMEQIGKRHPVFMRVMKQHRDETG